MFFIRKNIFAIYIFHHTFNYFIQKFVKFSLTKNNLDYIIYLYKKFLVLDIYDNKKIIFYYV